MKTINVPNMMMARLSVVAALNATTPDRLVTESLEQLLPDMEKEGYQKALSDYDRARQELTASSVDGLTAVQSIEGGRELTFNAKELADSMHMMYVGRYLTARSSAKLIRPQLA